MHARKRETTILQGNSNLGLTDPLPGEEPAAFAPPPAGQEGLLLVLWRERYVIGGCTVACLLLATIFLAFATPVYTSTARMSITQAASHLTGQAQAITDATAGNYLYTEQQLIQSPAVLSLAAQMPDVKPLLAGQPSPILFLQRYLDVEVGKRDTIVAVSFSSPDRQAAATIANAVVKAYTAYQTRPKPADTAELERLADERGKLEAKIAQSNQQMVALEQRYGPLTGAGAQGSLPERQLTILSQELATAHLDTLKAKAEYDEAAAAARAMGPAATNLDPADGLPLSAEQQSQIRAQILLDQARLDDLRLHYLPNHPAIRAILQHIAQLRGVYAMAIERQYHLAQAREHDLQENVDAQQKQAVEVSAAAYQYLRLQSDVDNARKIEEQIDNRRREVELARDLGMLNIDPYDPAAPQLKPAQPKRSVVLGVGLLLGLVLGSGAGFLHDWFDDRFRTVAEMRAATGLPMLGIIPQIADGLGPSIVGQQALLEPMSPLAEACRMIRTAIHFGAARDRRRTLLVTSPASGEGKSTLASNLAITLAQAGRRVLLIDADLRLPMQHKIFGAINQHGLSAILQGGATLDESVESTEVNGLDLLPAGPEAHNPAEMLNSPVFTELLDTLYDRYDHVVVDSAPVVGLADSRIIAASCDATVLVLRAGQSTRRVSELARGGLSSVGAQVVGFVVNDASEGMQSAYPYVAAARHHRRPRQMEPSAAVDPNED